MSRFPSAATCCPVGAQPGLFEGCEGLGVTSQSRMGQPRGARVGWFAAAHSRVERWGLRNAVLKLFVPQFCCTAPASTAGRRRIKAGSRAVWLQLEQPGEGKAGLQGAAEGQGCAL